MRFVKRVMERGVVTIPSEVREALGINEGDILEFEIVGVLTRTTSKPKGPAAPAAATAVPAGGKSALKFTVKAVPSNKEESQ